MEISVARFLSKCRRRLRHLRIPLCCLLLAALRILSSPAHGDTACADSDLLTIDNANCAESELFTIDNGYCAESSVFVIDNQLINIDFNGDGDVDLRDLAFFVACVSGPSVPLAAGCEDRDFDHDGDVDQSDFGVFQRRYGG